VLVPAGHAVQEEVEAFHQWSEGQSQAQSRFSMEERSRLLESLLLLLLITSSQVDAALVVQK
jgi:hypothetical protein